jgi:hypothetical protein
MIRIKNAQVTFAGIVERLSLRKAKARSHPRTIPLSGSGTGCKNRLHARSRVQAPVDPSPARRAPQSPCADRSLQRPGKPESPVQVQTQIKILRAPRRPDAVAPRQSRGSVRFAALWPRSLPIRNRPPLACARLTPRRRLAPRPPTP